MNNKEYEAKCCMYDILVEVDRICRKNNIKYTLIGGTLIGAIRHKGYIPWDDDIDVGFLRSEYDKFIKCCEKDLNKEYRIVNAENEEGNANLFHKIKIKNTKCIESISKNSAINKEIFLDVFPFDNSPNNPIFAYFHYLKTKFYGRLLSIECNYDFSKNKNIIKKLLNCILVIISHFYKKEKLINKIKKLSIKYNKISTKYIIPIYTDIGLKDRIKREWFSDYIQTTFENGKFYIIKNYDMFLRKSFGDYMQFPPIEERTSKHEILDIDLGNYKIKNYIKK